MSNTIYSIRHSVAVATLCLISEFSYGLVSCQSGIDYKNSCNPYDITFHKVESKSSSADNSYQVVLDNNSVKEEVYHSKSYFDSLLDRYRDSYNADYGFQSLIDRSSYSTLKQLKDVNEKAIAMSKPKSKPKPIKVAKTTKEEPKTQQKSIKFEDKKIASKTTNTKKSLKTTKIDKPLDNKKVASTDKIIKKATNSTKVVDKKSIKKVATNNKVKINSDKNKTIKVAKKVKKSLDTNYTLYTVKKGDSLIKIAKRFALKKRDLIKLNSFEDNNSIKIGQKIKLPANIKLAKVSTKKVDKNIEKGIYIVKKGDTLSLIAKKTNKSITLLREINRLSRSGHIKVGQKINLNAAKIVKRERRSFSFTKDIKFKKAPSVKYKRKIRVTATAYTSHRRQTDRTPFLAAWNNRLRPGMKIIAVSPDLIKKYGLTNGVRVKIMGLSGYYVVRDKMNKKWRNRIDIYMGTNKRRALNWGRRRIVLYW